MLTAPVNQGGGVNVIVGGFDCMSQLGSDAGDLCVRLAITGDHRRQVTVRRLDQDSSW